MKVFLILVFITLLGLLIASFLIPPVPIWLGGIIGIFIFIGVGNLIAGFIE